MQEHSPFILRGYRVGYTIAQSFVSAVPVVAVSAVCLASESGALSAERSASHARLATLTLRSGIS